MQQVHGSFFNTFSLHLHLFGTHSSRLKTELVKECRSQDSINNFGAQRMGLVLACNLEDERLFSNRARLPSLYSYLKTQITLLTTLYAQQKVRHTCLCILLKHCCDQLVPFNPNLHDLMCITACSDMHLGFSEAAP